VSIRIGYRLSLKLFFFFFPIEVVDDLFNVSFPSWLLSRRRIEGYVVPLGIVVMEANR
jgi:hypothetical protein